MAVYVLRGAVRGIILTICTSVKAHAILDFQKVNRFRLLIKYPQRYWNKQITSTPKLYIWYFFKR